MKKLLIIFLFISFNVLGQTNKHKTEDHTENGFTYQTVTNDPLNARVYTLKNGLRVYMTVYKNAPRIQTYIAVRAGSKNDPSTNTGLAHYLEHILFKGSSRIGTQNWDREKIELDKIEALYEKYRKVKDSIKEEYTVQIPEIKSKKGKTTYKTITKYRYVTRADIYHQIDSVSLVAASYSIANEYDKILSNIGATGTNAYTSFEQTVYVNDIPSNQIEKWAETEAERLSMVVTRLFHTELEAVYEEKNKGMDNDNRKVSETMFAALFPHHQYGTQTTIGTVEHLKNPSITEIKKYFNTYYVPNNVAICLSGDFDPDKTIQIIEKYFGQWKPKDIPVYNPPQETPITSPIIENVVGPSAESVTIAFRAKGKISPEDYKEGVDQNESNHDPDFLRLINLILSNGQAGLIDLNLAQKQKALDPYAYDMPMDDYSIFLLGGQPLEGQKLENVKDLLLGQLDSIKQGKFEDWLLKAVINDYKISKMREYESNKMRADAFVDAFIYRLTWQEYISEIDRMESYTKQDIVNFAKENFKDNYVVIYKRIGVDTTIHKVPKPKISAVPLNRDKQSAFLISLTSKPSETIAPVFLDYSKDIQQFNTKNKIPVNYVQNTENQIFSLSFVWDIGRDQDPKLAQAVEYIDLLGTSSMSNDAIKKEFFKLGCSYSFAITNDQTYFTLSGLNENFEAALKLFEKLISSPKADKKVWNDLVEKTLKVRADNKLSKDVILKYGMASYAKYGPSNPFTNILSEEQLRKLDPNDLVKAIKYSTYFKHRILYYGPSDAISINNTISKLHKVGGSLRDLPSDKKFPFKEIDENQVYYVNYDMVQAEIIFLSKSVTYDKSLAPTVYLFNQYFGGGMGSLVFQEMRESKALAYAVKSSYDQARKKNDPNYINSYIGTQADKIHESIESLQDLIDNMPESDKLFFNAKTSSLEMISTQRIIKAGILADYERSKRLGLDYDIRKDIFNNIKTMTFEDIRNFQQKYLKNKKKVILVIGSKDKIDFASLEKYGKVKELTLKEIFGY